MDVSAETTDILAPGFLLCSLASGIVIASAVFWNKKMREPKMIKDDDFEDINSHLQNDLKDKLLERINEVKQEIRFKKLQKDKNVKHLLKQQADEVAIKQSQYMIEKLEIESKYKEKIEALDKEVTTDINYLKDSLKNLQIILATASSSDNADTVSSTRSELECPVCLEEMRPPKKIWQCSDGHAICEFCRKKPHVTCCPVCRKYIVGRSNIAEKVARCVFSVKEDDAIPGTETNNKKFTLTGYKEIST